MTTRKPRPPRNPGPPGLGSRVRSLRLGAGLTRRNLAREAGLDVTQLVNVEEGRTGLSLGRAAGVARAISAATGRAAAEVLAEISAVGEHPDGPCGRSAVPLSVAVRLAADLARENDRDPGDVLACLAGLPSRRR